MTENLTLHELAGEALLDPELIVGRLQELGVDIEPEDFDELEDSDEVMAVILSFVTMAGLDIDDVLRQVTPIEYRRHDEDGEPTGKIEEPTIGMGEHE